MAVPTRYYEFLASFWVWEMWTAGWYRKLSGLLSGVNMSFTPRSKCHSKRPKSAIFTTSPFPRTVSPGQTAYSSFVPAPWGYHIDPVSRRADSCAEINPIGILHLDGGSTTYEICVIYSLYFVLIFDFKFHKALHDTVFL